MNRKYFFILVMAFIFYGMNAMADNSEVLRDVAFDQNIGKKITSRLIFIDEQDRKIEMQSLFKKEPSIFIFSYSSCANLCPMIMDNLISELRHIRPTVGKDFNIIFLSIDPNEKLKETLERKRSALASYGRKSNPNNWIFLRGNKEQIKKIANDMGFHFRYDTTSKQFAHPAGLIFLTPKGEVSSYLMGIHFNPKLIEAAITLAAQEKQGGLVESLLIYCFHYDPSNSKHGQFIIKSLRIASGVLILTMLGGFLKLSMTKRLM